MYYYCIHDISRTKCEIIIKANAEYKQELGLLSDSDDEVSDEILCDLQNSTIIRAQSATFRTVESVHFSATLNNMRFKTQCEMKTARKLNLCNFF